MANPYDRDPRRTGPPGSRRISPLVWLVLLLAMLAFGWYFYNQRGAAPPPPTEPVTPPAATRDAMTRSPGEGAEREPRTADDDAPAAGVD